MTTAEAAAGILRSLKEAKDSPAGLAAIPLDAIAEAFAAGIDPTTLGKAIMMDGRDIVITISPNEMIAAVEADPRLSSDKAKIWFGKLVTGAGTEANLTTDLVHSFRLAVASGMPPTALAPLIIQQMGPQMTTLISLGRDTWIQRFRDAWPPGVEFDEGVGGWIGDLFDAMAKSPPSRVIRPGPTVATGIPWPFPAPPALYVQADPSRTTFEGDAGAGIAKVRINGLGQLLAVELDPEFLAPENAAMLNDLIVGAFTVAAKKMHEAHR